MSEQIIGAAADVRNHQSGADISLAEIPGKLELLAQLDEDHALFGAAGHHYRLSPPLTEEQVAGFELRSNVRLPEPFRTFLLRCGSGGAGPAYGLRPLPDVLDRAGEGPEPANGQSVPRLLHLADIGCGYAYLLAVDGERPGAVWADYTEADAGITAIGWDFLRWYLDWLDGNLRSLLQSRAEAALAGGRPVPADLVRHLELFDPMPGEDPDPELAAGKALVLLSLGHRDAAERLLTELPRAGAALRARQHLYASDIADAAADPPAAPMSSAGHRAPEVRAALAANPSCPADALELLLTADRVDAAAPYELADLLLRDAVARNPQLPEAARARLAIDPADPGATLARAVALNPSCTLDELAVLAGHRKPWVRHAVAVNERTGADLLTVLATDPDQAVRAAVAVHRGTPPAVLAALAAESAEAVRAGAAGNPGTPAETLIRLATRPGAGLSQALEYAIAGNPELPTGLRACLLFDPAPPDEGEDDDLGEGAGFDDDGFDDDGFDDDGFDDDEFGDDEFGDDDLDGDGLDGDGAGLGAGVAEVVARELLGHPSFPVALLPAPGDELANLTAFVVARHPWLPSELLEALAVHPYGYAAALVAAHPGTGPELLVRMCASADPMVRAAAAADPRTPLEAVLTVAVDPVGEARQGAARHPGLPADVVERLAADPDWAVRRDLLFTETLPTAVVIGLAGDPSEYVRRWVSIAPACPAEVVTRLTSDPDPEVCRFAAVRQTRDRLAR